MSDAPDIRKHPHYAEGYQDAWYGAVIMPMTPEYSAGYAAGKKALKMLQDAGFAQEGVEMVIRGRVVR